MKKVLVLIMTVVMMTALLSGCSKEQVKESGTEPTQAGTETTKETTEPTQAATTEKKTTIKFVNGFTGGDGPFMQKIVDGFNNSQDKYYVDMLITDDHYTKFKSDYFDMLIIHADWISTYHAEGLLKEVSDIHSKAGLSLENDWVETAQSYAKYSDGVYAFPLDLYAYTMYYNKKYVSDAEVPKTYDDLLKLRDKLDSENTGVYVMGVPLSGEHQWTMMTMLNQNDVNWVKDEHLQFDETAADALMKVNDLIYKDGLSAPNLSADDHCNTFIAQADGNGTVQSVLSLCGPWDYSSFKEVLGDDLGVATIPQFGTEMSVPAGGHTFGVNVKCTDEAVLAGIAEFMKYVYSGDVLLNWADSGQAPIFLKTMETVKANPDKYPVAAVNYGIMDKVEILPAIYNIRSQISYLNETVWPLLVTTPDLTKEALLTELNTATEYATELSVLSK